MAATATAGTTSTSASAYLTTLLNRTLHVRISDGRLFVGQLKCTDREQNIVLSMTHEYRQPTQRDVERAAAAAEAKGEEGNVKVDMRKRFVGLVVLPGRCVQTVGLEG